MWLDGADTSTQTTAYQNLSSTVTGTSGGTTLACSGDESLTVFIGASIKVNSADIYSVQNVSTSVGVTTITVAGTLSNNYTALACATLRTSLRNDKSGNGNNAADATTARQPIYAPSIINSRGADGFNGSATNLTVTTSSSIDQIFATGGTVIYVIDPRGAGASGNGRVYDKTKTVGFISNFSGNLGKFNFFQATTGTSWQWSTDAILNQNAYNIIIVTYNASSVGTAPNIYINGTTLANLTVSTSGTGTASSDAGINLVLGNRAAVDRGFDGFVAEALAYPRTLSSSEISNMVTYLKVKWGGP